LGYGLRFREFEIEFDGKGNGRVNCEESAEMQDREWKGLESEAADRKIAKGFPMDLTGEGGSGRRGREEAPDEFHRP
jgi:hypothetical protein